MLTAARRRGAEKELGWAKWEDGEGRWGPGEGVVRHRRKRRRRRGVSRRGGPARSCQPPRARGAGGTDAARCAGRGRLVGRDRPTVVRQGRVVPGAIE